MNRTAHTTFNETSTRKWTYTRSDPTETNGPFATLDEAEKHEMKTFGCLGTSSYLAITKSGQQAIQEHLDPFAEMETDITSEHDPINSSFRLFPPGASDEDSLKAMLDLQAKIQATHTAAEPNYILADEWPSAEKINSYIAEMKKEYSFDPKNLKIIF